MFDNFKLDELGVLIIKKDFNDIDDRDDNISHYQTKLNL